MPSKSSLGKIKREMDDYRIKQAIGRGKFSQVFSSKNIKNDSTVVLKILKPGSKNRMVREVSILKVLQPHENI